MKPSASIETRNATRTVAQTVTLAFALSLSLVLAGCASDGTTYGNTGGGSSTGVYVIQNTPASGTTAASGSILEFSTSASGAATPIATIANPGVTSLAFLAVDGTGNLYTTNTAIVEYPVGSQNNAQPTRSIPFNTTTGLTTMSSLAVDGPGDIYASNSAGGTDLFSSTANGSVAPTSADTITSATGPQASAIDTSGNLYVATATPLNNIVIAPIVVFAPGSTTPARSISSSVMDDATPKGLATDTAGNLYVANVFNGVSSILVFPPTATGNTPPLRDITGSNTQLGTLGGIALDTEGYLYVVSTSGSPATPTVLKFSTTGDGNIAPVATFTSPAWTNPDTTLSIAVY